MLLLQKVEKGEIDSADADRLAGEALVKKQDAEQSAASSSQNANKINGQLTQLEQRAIQYRIR